MLENIEQGGVLDASGKLTLVGSVFMISWNWVAQNMTLEHFNHGVIAATSVFGMLYMFAKWRGQVIRNKKDKNPE